MTTAQTQTDENPLVAGLERLPVHPTALVIFGATGDLAQRKLLPALYNLAHEGALPERFALVGNARSEMTDEEFRQLAHGRATTYFVYPGYGENLARVNGWDEDVILAVRNHPQFTGLDKVPDMVFHRHEMLTPAERATVLDPGTAHPVPDRTLPQLFVEQVYRTPDAVAVLADGAALTYAELDALVGRWARLLRDRGVGPGSVVGVALPLSAELVVALHAVHQAGAAYLPLDTTYPPERLRFMLDEARPTVVLAASDLWDVDLGVLRGKYLVDAIGYNQVNGMPIKAAVLAEAIGHLVAEAEGIDVDLSAMTSQEVHS